LPARLLPAIVLGEKDWGFWLRKMKEAEVLWLMEAW